MPPKQPDRVHEHEPGRHDDKDHRHLQRQDKSAILGGLVLRL